jgi:hypothetical protein
LLSAFGTRTATGAETPPPELKFGSATLQLDAGVSEGEIPLAVVGERLPPADAKLSVRVITPGRQGEPALEVVIDDTPVEAGKGWRVWSGKARVSGLRPNAEVAFHTVLRYGEHKELAELKVTNRAEEGFEWGLTQPPKELVLAKDRETTFTARTGPVAATGVRIAAASLQDADTKALLGPGDLRLAMGPRVDGEAGAGREADRGLHLPALSTTGLVLRVDDGFRQPGKFTGKVSLTADQDDEAKEIELTVYSSSRRHQALGALAILVGTLVWLLVTVVSPKRVERLSALQAVALLSERARDLHREAAEAAATPGVDLPLLKEAFAQLFRQLTEKHLDEHGLIAPENPLVLWRPDRSKEFEAFLKATGERIQVLEVIVRKGVAEVLEVLAKHPNETQAIATAFGDLDALADPKRDLDLDKARAEVAKVLATLRSAVAGKGLTAAALATVTPVAAPSSRELAVRIEGLSYLVWVLWMVVTVGAGIAALILPDPGFGTAGDLLVCFFWGLGVQLAGQSLQQLNPTTVRGAFKLSVPA